MKDSTLFFLSDPKTELEAARRVLKADISLDQTQLESRLSMEQKQLEDRLSMWQTQLVDRIIAAEKERQVAYEKNRKRNINELLIKICLTFSSILGLFSLRSTTWDGKGVPPGM